MKQESVIGLTIHGAPFLVDKVDADLIGFRWSYQRHCRTKYLMGTSGPYKWQLMHRVILIRQNQILLPVNKIYLINPKLTDLRDLKGYLGIGQIIVGKLIYEVMADPED